LRESLALPKGGELALPPEPDAQPFEVFVQLARGKPHVHAGTVDAPDAEMALQFAREHYGQDQACVHIWVVPRAAMLGTDYERDVIWRSTDRTYKQARGYPVHRRWLLLRSKEAVREYEKEDLKESF
jgi:ring-1,2-phenylacetyl-CoA epoxidase subunit PaaB